MLLPDKGKEGVGDRILEKGEKNPVFLNANEPKILLVLHFMTDFILFLFSNPLRHRSFLCLNFFALSSGNKECVHNYLFPEKKVVKSPPPPFLLP